MTVFLATFALDAATPGAAAETVVRAEALLRHGGLCLLPVQIDPKTPGPGPSREETDRNPYLLFTDEGDKR